MDGFFERVYAVVRRIPAGTVATYGQVSRLAGEPRRARFVGFALHANPHPWVRAAGEPADAEAVPCHRVVFADGRLSPGFAFGGEGAQRALLEAEGVRFLPDGRVDLAASRWEAGA